MSDSTGASQQEALKTELLQLLNNLVEPESGLSFGALGAVQGVQLDSDPLTIQLKLPIAIKSRLGRLEESIAGHIDKFLQDKSLHLSVEFSIAAVLLQKGAQTGAQAIPNVKNIIAVASGKGGVGKSATAVNLALALQQEGAKVGILDADIYGPSQPLMLGVKEGVRPEVVDQKFFLPIEAYGLQTMSMGYMTTEKTPMVWRGPMASGALTQMIRQTHWKDLDYLIIDMPPGTGDIQLTLAQQIPCTGSVVVTTPQNIALLDARKGVEMFNKVGIPCLGIVENMATHICSACGHEDAIFGADGGQQIAAEYTVPQLGSLPLDKRIREGLDLGRPIVIAEPDSSIAEKYRSIARRLSVEVYQLSRHSATVPEIIVSDD